MYLERVVLQVSEVSKTHLQGSESIWGLRTELEFPS